MRNSLKWILGLLLAFAPLAALAQGPSNASYVAGRRVATNYAYGYGNIAGANIIQGNTATGSQSVTVCPAVRALADGRPITLFTVNVPVNFDTGYTNAETVVPTAVSLIAPPQGQQGDQQCAVISGTFNQIHSASTFSNQVRSGTYGLMEAVADAWGATNGGIVTVDPAFGFTTLNQLPTGTTLVNPKGLSNVYIEDLRGAISYWTAYPGLTNISAPTALTKGGGTPTLTTSTTGGTIATGSTPRFCVTAEDIFGGESSCSDDSNANAALVDGATVTNSYTITAGGVPAGTGIVGYRLYVSASGGATQTETLALPAQLSCTAAPQAPLVGSCLPGQPITLIALTTTTQAGPPIGTAAAASAMNTSHTTALLHQSHVAPLNLPFVTTAGPGFFPVTVTSATAMAQSVASMGELPYSAGFFNTLGATYRICGGGVTTPSAATVAGTWEISIGPRVSSAGLSTTTQEPVSVISFTASKQFTAVLTNFDFCTDVTVAATGATGTFEAHSTWFGVVINSTQLGTTNYFVSSVATAPSSTIDLTQQGVVSLHYVQSAASWTLPQLRYFSITPVN